MERWWWWWWWCNWVYLLSSFPMYLVCKHFFGVLCSLFLLVLLLMHLFAFRLAIPSGAKLLSLVCGMSNHTVPLHDLCGGNGMEDLWHQISLSLLVALGWGWCQSRETRDHLL